MLKRIKKGDTVIAIAGREEGKKGKVLKVLEERIVVEKMNLVKKHRKPSKQFQGGIIEIPAGINASNLMLVCPRCGKPTRISVKTLEEGRKVRVCKKCAEVIDKV
jgi:large subunit ribosomal protein L24